MSQELRTSYTIICATTTMMIGGIVPQELTVNAIIACGLWVLWVMFSVWQKPYSVIVPLFILTNLFLLIQFLTIETQNGGTEAKDTFYVMSTQRWAFDKPEDVILVLQDFIKRFK